MIESNLIQYYIKKANIVDLFFQFYISFSYYEKIYNYSKLFVKVWLSDFAIFVYYRVVIKADMKTKLTIATI